MNRYRIIVRFNVGPAGQRTRAQAEYELTATNIPMACRQVFQRLPAGAVVTRKPDAFHLGYV